MNSKAPVHAYLCASLFFQGEKTLKIALGNKNSELATKTEL